jgi:hypothetical protein
VRARLLLRTTLWIACVCLPGALLAGCDRDPDEGPAPPVSQGLHDHYCTNEEARRTGVVADTLIGAPNTRGLNPRNYARSREYEAPPRSLDDLRLDNVPLYREESFRSLLRQFLDEPRVAWDVRPLDSLAAREDVLEQLLRQSGDLARMVNVVDHRALVDCRAKVYRYFVSFWILKEPIRVLNEESYQVLESSADRIIRERLEAQGPNPDRVTINTDIDLVQPLLADAELRRRLRSSLREEDLEFLRTYVPGTWQFIQSLVGNTDSVFPFASGKYHVSGEMTYAVDLVVRTFARSRAPGGRYQIVSRGFADSDPIHTPIAYDGAANLRLGSLQIAPLADTVRGMGPIRTNQELSVARGYSGAVGIAAAIAAGITSEEERRTLEVFYSGGGPIQGPVRDSHRRIDIIILRLDPEGSP